MEKKEAGYKKTADLALEQARDLPRFLVIV